MLKKMFFYVFIICLNPIGSFGPHLWHLFFRRGRPHGHRDMVLAALKLNGFELKYCTATLQADKEAPPGRELEKGELGMVQSRELTRKNTGMYPIHIEDEALSMKHRDSTFKHQF